LNPCSALLALRDGMRRYKELENILGLSQSAVSELMKELRELGWVAAREIPRKGTGRPQKGGGFLNSQRTRNEQRT